MEKPAPIKRGHLPSRLRWLEQLVPRSHARKPVPIGTLADFARGLLTGTFTVADIDPTSADQISRLAEFHAHLVTRSPAHRTWADATPWAARAAAESERADPARTPSERETLPTLADIAPTS